MDLVPSALKAEADRIIKSEPNTDQEPEVETPQNAPEAAPPVETTPPAPPIEPAPATPAKTPEAPEVDWKHRFDVINGKYVKETARLRDQIKQLEGELEQARQSPQPPTAPAQPAAPTPAPSAEITDDMIRQVVSDDQIEEYGIEHWRTVLKAQRAMSPTNTEPSQTAEDVRQIKRSIEQQEQDRFYSELNQLVPNWEVINGSEAFEAFLDEVEPLSGFSYGSLLTDHAKRRDAVCVSNIFAAYARSAPKGSQPAPRDPAAEQVMPPSGPAPEPEAPKQGMTDDEYYFELSKLVTSGLTPMEIEIKRKEIIDRYKASRASVSAG